MNIGISKYLVTVSIFGCFLSGIFLFSMASADDKVGNKKSTLNYFRMSKDQFVEYSKLYAPGNERSKACHLEYLDCWQECIPGCEIGLYGQLVNCSSCYTTEQRCGKPTLVCDDKPNSGEYWTGEMESRKK